MSAQKGLKFTKRNKVDEAEELPYDALVNESTGSKRKSAESSDASRKRRSLNQSSASAASERSTNTARSQKSAKSVTKTVVKHHYPKTSYQLSEELQVVGGTEDHASMLQQLVHEIAEQERELLKAHSKSAELSTMKGRKYIFEALDALLAELPTIVEREVPRSVKFEVEGSKAPSPELLALNEVKEALLQHSAKLGQYESDFTVLAESHDLWLGSERIHQLVESVVPEPSRASEEEGKCAQYQELLTTIGQHCTTILDAEHASREIMQRAREAQDALYDSANAVRMQQAGKAKAPQDPKDLLRRMPALF